MAETPRERRGGINNDIKEAVRCFVDCFKINLTFIITALKCPNESDEADDVGRLMEYHFY